MDIQRNPKQNRILAALKGEDYAHLLPVLELVELPAEKFIYEQGEPIDYVYFPTTAIVSLISLSSDGASAELGMTGNDGMVGITLVLGGQVTTHQVVVQSAGSAYRLRAELMRWELDHGGELQRLALRYTLALMTQLAQTALCNRHHSVGQQLCRWLLLTLDRLPTNEIKMTQNLIANILGVRREAVTEAAGKLQASGLINYRRGCITVNDRPGLEARVCECYSVVKTQYELLFEPTPELVSPLPSHLNPAILHKRAEVCLQQRQQQQQQQQQLPMLPSDTMKLLHQLQVHQIELEMQNEELEKIYDESERLRRRYADIYDFAPIAYVSIDTLGVIKQINLAGAILLGIKASEMLRHRFASALTPTSLPIFKAFLDAVMLGNKKSSCEVKLEATAQRGLATVQIEGVTDENGLECRMVINDITLHRAAERKQAELEKRYRMLIEALPFSAVIAQDGVIQLVNPRALELFGYAPKDKINEAFRPITAENDDIEMKEADHQRINDEFSAIRYEICLLAKDGRMIDCMVDSVRIEWEDRNAEFIVIEDISKRKQLADALRQKDFYQSALLDSFPFLVWLKDENSCFLAVNRAYAEACQQPSVEALVGKTDFDVWPKDLAEVYRADDLEILKSGKTKRIEEIIEVDGQRVWYEAYKSTVQVDNHTIGTVGFARDITDIKEAGADSRRYRQHLESLLASSQTDNQDAESPKECA